MKATGEHQMHALAACIAGRTMILHGELARVSTSHLQGRKGMYALTRLYARSMLPFMRGILLYFLRRILRFSCCYARGTPMGTGR